MDRSVAVTGGASGLGRVIATILVERGRPVVIVDRDGEQALTLAAALRDRHQIPVSAVVADLGTMAGAHLAADHLIGRCDVGALVNNAGGWLPGDQYPAADADRWLSAITLNLIAPMILAQRLYPMLAAACGAVVNIGSSAGEGDAAYGSPEYGAAKAGLRRFTASLGSRSDVRVMCVIAGWIGLERAHREWAALTADEQLEIGPLIPPEDIAKTVVHLLEHGQPGEIVEMLRGREH